MKSCLGAIGAFLTILAMMFLCDLAADFANSESGCPKNDVVSDSTCLPFTGVGDVHAGDVVNGVVNLRSEVAQLPGNWQDVIAVLAILILIFIAFTWVAGAFKHRSPAYYMPELPKAKEYWKPEGERRGYETRRETARYHDRAEQPLAGNSPDCELDHLPGGGYF